MLKMLSLLPRFPILLLKDIFQVKEKKNPQAVIWIPAKSVTDGQMNRSVNGQTHRQTCGHIGRETD